MTTAEKIKAFLSRIEDETGTVRRYAEALKNEPPWITKEARDDQ